MHWTGKEKEVKAGEPVSCRLSFKKLPCKNWVRILVLHNLLGHNGSRSGWGVFL